jgi:hypothetical protein
MASRLHPPTNRCDEFVAAKLPLVKDRMGRSETDDGGWAAGSDRPNPDPRRDDPNLRQPVIRRVQEYRWIEMFWWRKSHSEIDDIYTLILAN